MVPRLGGNRSIGQRLCAGRLKADRAYRRTCMAASDRPPLKRRLPATFSNAFDPEGLGLDNDFVKKNTNYGRRAN